MLINGRAVDRRMVTPFAHWIKSREATSWG
jgi:hypothetical protein